MPVYFRSEALITIPFEEVAPTSPQENYSLAGFDATRKLKCAYADRHTLARQLLGVVFKSVGLVIVRIPHRHPSFDKALCQGVGMEPFGGILNTPGAPTISDEALYPQAMLTVRYAIPDGITIPDPTEDIKDATRTERLETSAQFITIPEENLFFDAANTIPAEGINPGFLLVTQDWTVTLFNEPEIPPGIQDLIGGVNDADMTSRKLDQTFEPGTLLYNTPTYDRSINSRGDNNFTITFRLTHNPFGWNKFVQPGVFETVDGKKLPKFVQLFDDTGQPFFLYQPKDFSTIIAP